MKKTYFFILTICLSLTQLDAQNEYQFHLSYLGLNVANNNHQVALIATPNFDATELVSNDMGMAFYVPAGYTIGNFQAGDSGLAFYEWQLQQQSNSYDGGNSFLKQIIRTEIIPNTFTHTIDTTITLVIFDVISENNTGNLTSGEISIAFASDANVTSNQGMYETYINMDDGFLVSENYIATNPTPSSINFSALSTSKAELAKVSSYPNPTNGIVTIKGVEKLESIELTNLNGQRLLDYNFNSNILDISNLNSGVYFLKLATSTAQKTIKVIKD